MTNRERLINELKKAKNRCLIYEGGGCLACAYRGKADCTLENLADYLLANGVIVPPCKVGDRLWNIHYNRPKEWKVVYIGFNGEEWHINVHWSDKDHFVTREIDGKYLDRMFFRTKEEAEQALKEMK